MRFEVVIFDFDGTLVDSARAKCQAFFSLFPSSDEHRRVVASVLERDPDGSRYRVIPLMFQEMVDRGLSLPAHHSASERIEAYGELVLAAVRQAQEIRGAGELLQGLRGRCTAYISSNTPEPALRSSVAARGWNGLVAGVFGYPRDKASTAREVIHRHGCPPARVAVVGDGESDAHSAHSNGCAFFLVRQGEDLREVTRALGDQD